MARLARMKKRSIHEVSEHFSDVHKVRYEINYSGHIHVDNVEAMTRLCLAGLGVATPPDFLVDGAIKDQRLVELIPDWRVDPLPLIAVWPGNVETNRSTRRILSYLSA